MKNKYRVTFELEDGAHAEEVVLSDTIMAGAQNGVLVAFDYVPGADPAMPTEPRMVRMWAQGVWKMVENQGAYLAAVPPKEEVN